MRPISLCPTSIVDGMKNSGADILRMLLIVKRILRGHWTRYGIFAGTTQVGEVALALGALLGLRPLAEGPEIELYERRFAEIAGTRYAFSFAAGRMSLYALLEALGIGAGDEVILPAFTCVVVPNAILYCGARPVYVDIDARTFNIDPAKVSAAVTHRTRAIIAQHTFGLVCDMDEIGRLANRYDLPVIEDCAHALGASLRGRPAGSLATAAYFSTDHTKVISTGTGGIVTTSDHTLAAALRAIHDRAPFLAPSRIRLMLLAFVCEAVLLHPRAGAAGRHLYSLLWKLGLRRGFFLDELEVTKPCRYPYPARLSNAQARIGLSQLLSLPQNLDWRRSLARLFDAEIGACAGLLAEDFSNHAFLRYSFTVEDREQWENHFDDVLDMGVWFTSVVHGRDRDLDHVGYRMGSCPIAEAAARHCVNLPTHPRVNRPALLTDPLRAACTAGALGLARRAESTLP